MHTCSGDPASMRTTRELSRSLRTSSSTSHHHAVGPYSRYRNPYVACHTHTRTHARTHTRRKGRHEGTGISHRVYLVSDPQLALLARLAITVQCLRGSRAPAPPGSCSPTTAPTSAQGPTHVVDHPLAPKRSGFERTCAVATKGSLGSPNSFRRRQHRRRNTAGRQSKPNIPQNPPPDALGLARRTEKSRAHGAR
jgi:hypothetical protein